MTPAAPVPPSPLKVDRDTWLLRGPEAGASGPGGPAAHSLVIRAQEPVVVDTGGPAQRDLRLADVFSIVDPGDVRWVFVSHDDADHAANLDALLAACPRAVLVASRLTIHRLGCRSEVPTGRWRAIADGESLAVGDRSLVAMAPPLFDVAGTTGLYDTRSGVYWAADCFAIPDAGPADDCADLPPARWRAGLLAAGSQLSPWSCWVDEARWAASVDRVEGLGIDVIASGHAPLVTGALVDAAFQTIRQVPAHELTAPGLR